jgi:16S rRNA (cytosine967-C5)-methyltransferase
LDAFSSVRFEENLYNGQIPPNVRASCPEDLYEMIVDAYGEKDAFDMCHVLNERPPLTIRTNTVKILRYDLAKMLRNHGYNIKDTEHSPMGITFLERPKTNFFALPEFKKGFFEIQDEGSQLTAMRVDCKPGQTVLDYCGGAGGKTLAFAPFMHDKGQIYMHDIRKSVLLQAKKRFKRANIHNVQTQHDKTQLWDQINRKCHWVL